MIEHDYKELFGNDSIDKQLVITTDDGAVTITNTELHNEAFELTESISDNDSLVFGNVSASSLKFTVSNIFTDLKNKWLTVTTYLNHDDSNSFQIGRYKVCSDVPTADRKNREIKAYDALYNVLNADVSVWYNTILPKTNSSVTLKQFRDSFFSHFGIEQEQITLINDGMVVKKTIEPEELSGKVVLNAICEINGCFGHIGRNGKFKYIYLEPIQEGLYPSETLYPSEKLYPNDPNTNLLKTGEYISANYEDYLVEKITKIQIRKEEDDIGAIIGSGDNAYIIHDNFLVYGKSASELNTIGNNVLDKIGGIYYRPFTAKAKGNPCLEVGDGISLSTKYMAIHSYILNRTLSGIQALRDEYTAEGAQYQPTEVNGVHRSIQQLKGKTNKLTRTVDETRLEMSDMEKELYSTISVTAGEIRTEVENTKNDLESSITQTDNRIAAEVTRAKEAEASLKIQADEIALSVSDLENDVNSQISVLERRINLKVDAGDIINEINISDEAIELKGNRLIVNSKNFKLDKNGNAEFSGVISGGSISLETENGDIKTVMETTVFSSGNVSLSLNEEDEFDYVDIYGPVYILGGNSSESFLGVSEISCSNIEAYGDISCDTLNGYTPITSENIDDYIPNKSDFVTNDEMADAVASIMEEINTLDKAVDSLKDKVSDRVTYDELEDELSNYVLGSVYGAKIGNLENRIKALEAAL